MSAHTHILKQRLTKWEPHLALGCSLLLSETNLEWMNYICLFSLSSSPPKSFCFIIHNTAVPHGFPERKICCHMAVGNNTGLSIIWVVGLIFTKELLVLACGVNVNILNIPIKNCLLCRFLPFQKSLADVERCTHVVHLFRVSVWGRMWSFNIV